MISPHQFDTSAGNPGHDSTSAIAAAIAATPSGGTMYLPAAAYTVSDGFTITRPINIIGDGFGTNFVGKLPASTDLFHVACPAATWMRGLSFQRFAINVTGGRYWFHLDTTSHPAMISECEISHILAVSPPGLSSIAINNNAANVDGGTWNSWFEKNQFAVNNGAGACISVVNGGDTLRVRDCVLSGIGYAINLNQITNAGNFVCEGCSIEATGGIFISRAVKPIIRDFEIEFSAPLITCAGIDFAGADGGTIGPGQIQILPNAGNFAEAIYLANSTNVTIDGIRFASGRGGVAINKGSSSNTQVGPGNSFSGFKTNVM
jgi:hypothetical protein